MGATTQPPQRTTTIVPDKDWATKVTLSHQLDLQQKIVIFLLVAYGFLLVSTISLFFLEGFKPLGFNLDGTLLKWLGLATVGEIGGLLTLTFGAIFRGQKK